MGPTASAQIVPQEEGRAAPSRPTISRQGVALNLMIWAGSVLLLASALIHFHLWDSEGYRHIPTIGPLFMAQVIVSTILALATAITRNILLVGAAAGTLVASIGALLISIWWGLFNWQESSGAPYVGMVLWVESVGAVLLGLAFLLMAATWWSAHRSVAPSQD